MAAASSRSTWSPTAPPRDGAAPPLNLTASLRRRGAHAGAGAPRDADVLVAVLLSGDVSEFAQAPRPSAWPRRVEAALDFFVALESTLGAAPGARFDVAALVFEDAPDAPGLDFGERYHHCDAYRSFAAKDKFARTCRCDVHQLLARSFLPLRTVDAGPGAGKRAAELLRGLAAPYGVVVPSTAPARSARRVHELAAAARRSGAAHAALGPGELPKLPRAAKQFAAHPLNFARVYERTLSFLLSLEGHGRDAFDLVVCASPRPGDRTADALEAAGYEVLRQPGAVPEATGLTDLWNRAVALGLARGYEAILVANNDVLVPDGAVAALLAALRAPSPPRLKSPKPPVVVPAPNDGGGSYHFYAADGAREASYAGQALSFARVGGGAATPIRNAWARDVANVGYRLPGWTAFFFLLDAAWARAHLLEGGRLWNDTRWKNFGQEAELSKRTRTKVEYAPDAYVFHFRGGTLGAKACQNGHKDCATWQKNHRPDVGVYVRGMF
ncbi:hypothetical protein JL722_12996 [Aureococcus anophagefferens]|nr:hypothetical protein JL722_12996 [Aureococcus anophagefferens]